MKLSLFLFSFLLFLSCETTNPSNTDPETNSETETIRGDITMTLSNQSSFDRVTHIIGDLDGCILQVNNAYLIVKGIQQTEFLKFFEASKLM